MVHAIGRTVSHGQANRGGRRIDPVAVERKEETARTLILAHKFVYFGAVGNFGHKRH